MYTKLQSDIWLIQILQWYCHGHFCLPFLEGGNSKYTVTKSFFNIIMALLQLSRYFCWLAYFTLYTMYNFCQDVFYIVRISQYSVYKSVLGSKTDDRSRISRAIYRKKCSSLDKQAGTTSICLSLEEKRLNMVVCYQNCSDLL